MRNFNYLLPRLLYSTVFLLAFGLSTLHLSAQSTLRSTSFSSPALNGETIPVEVYLPDGYATSGKDYPLYIFFHGCCGHAPVFFDSLYKARLDTLIGSGDVEPMVVAFPTVLGADYGNRHIYQNSSRNGDYGDAMAVDLLAFMDDSFAVSSDARLRAIGGFSMGGDGAWRLGLTHSGSFQHVLSHGAFPSLDVFPALIGGAFLQEQGGTAPYTFHPDSGAVSGIVFGVSSAWSPNPANAPYFLDLPWKSDGNLDTAVFQSWYPVADVNTIFRQQYSSPGPVSQSYYVDVGSQVGLLFPPNEAWKTQMETLRMEGYSFRSKYIAFDEDHVLSKRRIDSSLIWLSQQLREVTTSVEPASSGLSASLFQSEDMLRIRLTTNEPPKPFHIDIIDMSGKVVVSGEPLTASQTDIRISTLPSGLYILRLQSGNQQRSWKFIR